MEERTVGKKIKKERRKRNRLEWRLICFREFIIYLEI